MLLYSFTFVLYSITNLSCVIKFIYTLMQSLYSLVHASNLLEHLIDKAYQLIQLQKTLKKMPSFLQHQSMNIISLMQGVQQPFVSNNKITQQNQKAVPKIQKDSLMPKQLESQKLYKEVSKNTSAVYSIVKSKKPSKLAKPQQSLSLNASLKSTSLNSRPDKGTFQSSMSRYESLKKDEDIDDPQIKQLRDKTQMRFKYENQSKNMILQRQKSFTSKLEQYNKFAQNSVGVTNEYDGQQMQSTIQAQKNIKYYNMKASFAPQAKKKLDILLVEQKAKTIDFSNGRRQKQSSFKQIKEMQLPLFPAPKRQLPQMNEVKNYKLLEYKKYFGHKYSRLDEYSKTINLSTVNNDQNKDEIFSQRRHLKDSSTFSQQLSKVSENLSYSRRLALPRLNGKYKVLDRYQSS